MFIVRNVPVVIEPGVEAVEAEFVMCEATPSSKCRTLPLQLFRVPLDGAAAEHLPFIPSTRAAHVFSPTVNLEDTSVLVLYDNQGRIAQVFNRDETGKSWERKDVADEHAGRAVTQFSVRFCFSTAKTRDKFMELIDGAMTQHSAGQKVDQSDVAAIFGLLRRSRVGPVVLPVAADRTALKSVKL